jgi:dolichol-phosphate mannosyltransferase
MNSLPKRTASGDEPVSVKYVRSKIFAVLPAYNEEANIGRLLTRIGHSMCEADFNYEVIVVDDGSQDGTRHVLDEYATMLPVRICAHPVNLGLGAAIRDGLQVAVQAARENDIIITMDADETHSPGLIMRMARMIQEGFDVVIASRYQAGSRVLGVPLLRRLMSFGASWLFRILFPTPGVRDFTCGYRAYRAGALKKAIDHYGPSFVDQNGFQCMVDIILKLRTMDIIFGEVPMLLRYDLKAGASKMRVYRTAKNTLLLLAKRRLGW